LRLYSGLICKGQKELLTMEDGTNILTQNVGYQLLSHTSKKNWTTVLLQKPKHLYNMATVSLQWLCLKTDYFNNIYSIPPNYFFDTLFYFFHFEWMVFGGKDLRNVGWMQKEKDCGSNVKELHNQYWLSDY